VVPVAAGTTATSATPTAWGPRGLAGPPHHTAGRVCRGVVIWISVAALLVIDFDDLVGRGTYSPRRRGKVTAKHVRGPRSRALR